MAAHMKHLFSTKSRHLCTKLPKLILTQKQKIFTSRIVSVWNQPLYSTICNFRLQPIHCSPVVSSNIKKCTRTYSASVQQEEVVEEDDVLYKAIELEIKAHDTALLNSYEQFIKMATEELDIKILQIWTPPRVIERYSKLKSVHVYKKHFVQYETRTYYRTIQLKHLTGSTADTFLEYIERNLPEGIAMKVTRHKVEVLPNHIKPPKEAQV